MKIKSAEKHYAKIFKERGDALIDLNKSREATEYFDKAIQINPNDDEETVLNDREDNDLNQSKVYKDEIVFYNKAMKVNLNCDIELFSSNADCSKCHELLEYNHKAIQIDPNCAETLFKKGAACEEIEWCDTTIQMYQKRPFTNKALHNLIKRTGSITERYGRPIANNPNLVEEFDQKENALNSLTKNKIPFEIKKTHSCRRYLRNEILKRVKM